LDAIIAPRMRALRNLKRGGVDSRRFTQRSVESARDGTSRTGRSWSRRTTSRRHRRRRDRRRAAMRVRRRRARESRYVVRRSGGRASVLSRSRRAPGELGRTDAEPVSRQAPRMEPRPPYVVRQRPLSSVDTTLQTSHDSTVPRGHWSPAGRNARDAGHRGERRRNSKLEKCWRRDLNPHPARGPIKSRLRIPVSPRQHDPTETWGFFFHDQILLAA
jgi:hypothetical protein